MIKRIALAAVVLALAGAGAGAVAAQAADVEDGGGQYPKLCYVWNGQEWQVTPSCP